MSYKVKQKNAADRLATNFLLLAPNRKPLVRSSSKNQPQGSGVMLCRWENTCSYSAVAPWPPVKSYSSNKTTM